MSDTELTADELERPIKRTRGDTLEERLTGNAYHNILPARYLRKDSDGDLAESQEDLFERVGKNIALAEAVYEARSRDTEVTVGPDQLKPDHPRRDELAEEVFGAGTSATDDWEADDEAASERASGESASSAETTLSIYNVNKFAYETVVPELPEEIRDHVEAVADEFVDLMEQLSFMPNCVPPESMIATEGGLKQLTDIDPGDRVYDDRDGEARVESKFENGEKLVREIETNSGYTVRATPEHYFRVITDDGTYDWRQVKDLRPDDVLALQKNFLDDRGSPTGLRPNGATDGGTATVSGDGVARPKATIETPDEMTPDLAEWLGLYVGDGTARESGIRVAFDGEDGDLVDYWQELTETVFGFEPTTRERTNAKCVVGQAYRRLLYEFLDRNDLLKDTSKTATVPEAVLESGRTCVARFLRGLFEADGTVGDRAIELYTHSEPLADQVQQLLLGLGIRATVRPKGEGYRVTVRKNVCGRRFVEEVGFRSERKRADAERFETVSDNASTEQYPELWESPVAEFVDRDQFYEPVEEISDVGRMAVEDMQVPRRNTYVVEGFVSHNSPTLMNAGDELQQLSACIAGHAPVYTRDGLKRMDEITPGDEVLTHEGRFKPVVDHWSNGEKDTVEMRRGIERGTCFDTQLTPDHEVYTDDGKWVRADEVENPADPTFPSDTEFPEILDLRQYTGRLKKEKEVVVDGGHVKLRNADDHRTPEFDQQNNQPTARVVNDDTIGWLFGLYLAEGDVYDSDLRFTIGAEETDLRERLIDSLERTFDVPVSVSESSHGQWVQLRVSSSFVADLFATVIGVGGDKKRIPEWVGRADESYRQAILDGLLAGDGTELDTAHKLVLANPTLVYETTLLARSLGYDTVFKLEKERDLSTGPTSECYISTAENSRLSNVARREAESAEVYDMEVADDHSFVVGDFVVHNCFVDSPGDDIDDIHQTAKEAAQVFQCLTEESTVVVEGEGPVSVSEVEAGDRVAQQAESGFQYKPVEETHVYEDAETLTVSFTNGLDVRGTPNHRLLVDGEWTRLDEIQAGQEVHYALGWLRETTREEPALTSVASGAQWDANRSVENAEILELYERGFSDYEIAERLDCGKSTVQRRRSHELDLPPNGNGGRDPGSTSFDEAEALELYEQGHSDTTVADEVGVSTQAVARFRARERLAPNGTPVKTVRQPERLTEDLAELVGLWVGDGSYHEDGVRFHAGRESVADYVDELSRQLFDTPSSVSFADGCYEIGINSHEIKRWWETNFDCKPDGARSARVPQAVKRAPAAVVRAFLRGYFTADGTLLDDTYPKLYSASEQAIDDVATLMMGLGYPVKKSVIRDEDAHPYYGLVPTTGDGREAFLREVGFVDERRETGLANAESVAARDSHTVGEGHTVTVNSVAESEPATVYDITVADNHEYVTDGIVSHNSGGGMGYAFWKLRPYGDPVGSTGGIASGPITFMRTYDQMCETIAQGGARRGAQMGVMRVSHPDVVQFIHAKNKDVSLAETLRLNDPDDFTHNSFADALDEARELIDDDGKVPEHLRNAVEGHLSNFNISVGITDDFMDAVQNDEEFTFTNPRTGEAHVATPETKELYDMFGLGEYVEVGEELSIPAQELWEDIVEGAHENGEPGVIYLERVNKKHSFDVEEHPEHRILATNPCVTGDTLISTEDGLVSAEELYEQGVARDVVVDGRLGEDRVKEASSVYKTGEKDVYKLTTEEGYALRLTADHRVMTDDGWTEAQNLDADDTVHVQNRKGEFGQHGSAEEGRVLGWLVGDGHLKDGEERAVLNFYDEDADISEGFATDVNSVVRAPAGSADYEIGVNEISRSDDYRGAQAVEQRIRSARLYEYADETGLVDEKLQVPDAVMRGSEEMARSFLRALFTADGSVQGTAEDGSSVRLASKSLDLVKEVQQLLLNFGIASKVYEDRREPGTWELPDGKGGTKEYETEGFHEVAVAKDNLERFREEIGFLLDYKNEALDGLLDEYDRGPYSERYEATVESVEPDGNEAVYDLTEPDTNSFVANGLVVHNCGEQPLEEYEACNLGHINFSTLAAEDAPDWRVWSERHAAEYDSEEAAVAAFLEDAIDWDAFDHRIAMGTRFLENVVTMSDFPVERIEETVREMRKIGLGIMGLAQLYIQLGLSYGSDASNEVARQLMTHINHESKWASHELAEERGSFDEWDNSKYADPTEYREWFEKQTGLDADDWEDGFPIRNHNSTTIAPTGCVEENSLVSTDQGIVPIKELDETTAEFEQWDEIEVGVSTDGGTKTATAVYDNGFADVRRIETDEGFDIAATPNHRFRTITADGDYAWKEADDFESGDHVVLQRNTFDNGSRATLDTSERNDYHWNSDESLELPAEMTPELAEFLGYFIGDGYVHEEVGVKLVVESDAEELDAYLRELGESLFGVTPTVEDRETRHILTFGGRHLPRYFVDNGWKKADGNKGEGAASAFVPDEVLAGTEEIVTAFLRGLFEADGTASRKIELSTVSATLADQVQTLLLSLGCVFVRDTLEMADRDDHYGDRPRNTVRGANKREDKRFVEEIGFITKSTEFDLTPQSYKNDTYPPAVVDVLRDIDGYGSVSERVRKRVNQSPINGSVSRKLVRDVERETGETVRLDGRRLTDFYVATVDEVSEETAYTKDISVPANNTYIADGFVTHNTTSMVGNTTGGCEPIYNVAYYKNVSDDVQGDEMLVEFDDYFLRTLEANDVDVEAVKREAQEQMAENEFDGVDGLTTVPDAIGELFVVTGDLSAKQHAAIQCACQEGVDSAISKTVNAPNDSTVEDAAEVFEWVYEHGGKGVTYYRDGTRSKQVLTTRAQNAEFADMDAEQLVAQIEETFGGIEGFLEDDAVQAAIDDSVASLLEAADGERPDFAEKRDRPDVLHGVTQRIDTGYGKLYVNINEDPEAERPFELFANIGNSGGFTASFTEALAKTISTALRSGVDPDEIADELQGIRSPKVAWDKGEQIQSIPDAIGTALRRYLDGDIERSYPQQQTLDETADDREIETAPETDGGATVESTSAEQDLIEAGESPECPECGAMSLYYSEGCKTCESCGWSEC